MTFQILLVLQIFVGVFSLLYVHYNKVKSDILGIIYPKITYKTKISSMDVIFCTVNKCVIMSIVIRPFIWT